LPTLTTVTSTTPFTARGLLGGTAAQWGWEAISACNCSPRESCYRRAPFTISVVFSERDSDVAYSTLWLDKSTGTQGPQQRCIAVIDEGDFKGHRVEVWMMMHGESATART
jgi:hypothetical protein